MSALKPFRRIAPALASTLALSLAAVALASDDTTKPAAPPPSAPARPATPPARPDAGKPAAPPAAAPGAAKPAPAKPADAAKGGAPAGGADEAAMMEAWSKYMTPGPEHAKLLRWVGEWDLDVTQFTMPGAPPQTSKATSRFEPAMGGRYVIERVRGEAMGMPFEGMGTTGYDNVLRKFVFTWIDSMGTGITNGSGTMSADGKTMNASGKMVDPVQGKEVPYRQVMTFVDDNTRKVDFFNTGADGKEFKSMELVYKRKGAAPPATPAVPADRK